MLTSSLPAVLDASASSYIVTIMNDDDVSSGRAREGLCDSFRGAAAHKGAYAPGG